MYRFCAFCAVLLMTSVASAQGYLFGHVGAVVVPRRTVQVAVLVQPTVAVGVVQPIAVAEADCAVAAVGRAVPVVGCAVPVVGYATHALVATTRVRRVRIGRAMRIARRQARLGGRLGCLFH